MRSFAERLAELGLSVLGAALLISFAWSLIEPLAPVLLSLALGGVAWRYFIQRRKRF